jgi:hypothetical protein
LIVAPSSRPAQAGITPARLLVIVSITAASSEP